SILDHRLIPVCKGEIFDSDKTYGLRFKNQEIHLLVREQKDVRLEKIINNSSKSVTLVSGLKNSTESTLLAAGSRARMQCTRLFVENKIKTAEGKWIRFPLQGSIIANEIILTTFF